jgi:crotonobetainyl-CoA:carnitine CoA-transferase CaiB-like acyl-CoA transferase
MTVISAEPTLPLAGIRVVEFVHMIMGPSCGLILADLGADVIKVEPAPHGDNTRRMVGAGAGFFATYNRNKRSLAVDVKSADGRALVHRLVRRADVVSENFRPGAMDALGLGYDELARDNPGLIYCSHKGFLDGPYEERTALDEVVQMMGGLAYMTGLPDRPLRAGASVNDVMGGMFGVIGILAAVIERRATGRGQRVRTALFENNVFLMAQHMMQYAVSGKPARPMSVRDPAWGIYDIFRTADDDRLFVAVVTDTQWRTFCEAFAQPDLLADATLASNTLRVRARARLVPQIEGVLCRFTKAELIAKCEACGLPFAPITRPDELFDDPHLNTAGGLVSITLPGGASTKVPALPLDMGGRRTELRHDLAAVGAHSREIARELGYAEAEIERMIGAGVLSAPPAAG